MSVVPPGAKGPTNFTGRDGQVSARDLPDMSGIAPSVAAPPISTERRVGRNIERKFSDRVDINISPCRTALIFLKPICARIEHACQAENAPTFGYIAAQLFAPPPGYFLTHIGAGSCIRGGTSRLNCHDTKPDLPLSANAARTAIRSLALTVLVCSFVYAAEKIESAEFQMAQDKPGAEAPPKTLSAKELAARGNDFAAKGDNDRAIADFDAALKIDPIMVEAINSRAMAWRAKGDRRKALTDLDAAIRLKPDFEVARANRKILFHEIELQGAQMPLKPSAPTK